jgi:hypothetical protein
LGTRYALEGQIDRPERSLWRLVAPSRNGW